jgi:hypothetical protein
MEVGSPVSAITRQASAMKWSRDCLSTSEVDIASLRQSSANVADLLCIIS